MPIDMRDINRAAFDRAERAYLREPESDVPQCSCCGCKETMSTELYLYRDEAWCYDCLEYDGLQPDDIDDLPLYDDLEVV